MDDISSRLSGDSFHYVSVVSLVPCWVVSSGVSQDFPGFHRSHAMVVKAGVGKKGRYFS